MRMYSNAEKNNGNANREYLAFNFKVTDLVSIIIPAKMNAGANVSMMAGIIVATFTKYRNQLNRPIKYAVKEAQKATFFE
jgi:hypothetical protein